MSYNQGHPQLGATFVPGGFDDYYMPQSAPELISPAPQRIMPEVPENMQDNLAHLELEANGPRSSMPPQPSQSYNPTPASAFTERSSSYQSEQAQPGVHGGAPGGHWPQRNASISSAFKQPPAVPVQPVQQAVVSHDYNQFAIPSDLPNFSPFPRLRTRPAHVPSTDDEKEAVLENARVPVLNSNDPEMQLTWAQDALAYVDASQLHELRLATTQPPRPSTPQVEHQLRVDAMNIVGFLADQHHPKAEFMKGMWLEFGKFGMRVDKKDAFRCYTRAAEKGYARAEYRMGMQFEQSNDPIKALMHYKRGSEAGDSASNYRLGMMTLLGQHGQPQDYAKGIQLIRQAAATADENAPQGAYVLGMLQARELPQINVPEIFLPYDEKSARQSIEKAAYLGFAKAQLKMGSAYELCTLGCEFNPTLSMHYNALASRQGESDADMAISKWFLCGYENEFKKNEELAYAYAERAAASNLATAQFAMGYFNEIGMATEKNLEKASDWYEKAARAGNKDAASRLEGLAKSQTLNKKDHENIAIQKIKSQYGSMRGARPARLQKHTVPALPSIVDDSPSAASDASPMANRLPDRNASTTPYPISDKPPVVANVPALGAPSPYDRGSTTTPYPMGDGPPMGPPRTGSFAGGFAPEVRSASTVPPNSRPLSAFNINPNIYPQDRPGTVVPPRLAPYQQGNMGQMPMRPYTSMDNMGQGGGRDPRDVRMNGFPPDPNPYRGPGTPSVERPEPYGTPRPGDYGGQPGHRPGDYAGRPGPRPGDYGGQPGRPDMGYQAPSPQVPPPDGRNKLQKVGGNPNKLKAQPTLPDIGFEAPLAPAPLAPKHGPKPPQHSQSFSNGRPATVQPGQDRSSAARPQERPGTAAPGGYPAPRPGSSGKPGRGDSPQPPLKNDKSDLPSQRKPGEQKKPIEQKKPGDTSRPADKPAAAPAAPKPAAAHQPGKGPKTFDEMGVPAQAGKENECIVM